MIQGRPDTLTNPILLAEVLSDATREYDRGQKFNLYKGIPSLRQYILVEQAEVLVETFQWTDGVWTPRRYDTLDTAVTFTSIDLTMSLREIYREVFA